MVPILSRSETYHDHHDGGVASRFGQRIIFDIHKMNRKKIYDIVGALMLGQTFGITLTTLKLCVDCLEREPDESDPTNAIGVYIMNVICTRCKIMPLIASKELPADLLHELYTFTNSK
jgi:hypothetical protein